MLYVTMETTDHCLDHTLSPHKFTPWLVHVTILTLWFWLLRHGWYHSIYYSIRYGGMSHDHPNYSHMTSHMTMWYAFWKTYTRWLEFIDNSVCVMHDHTHLYPRQITLVILARILTCVVRPHALLNHLVFSCVWSLLGSVVRMYLWLYGDRLDLSASWLLSISSKIYFFYLRFISQQCLLF